MKLYETILANPLSFSPEPIVSQDTKDLLKSMLVTEEKGRISWEDLFKHPVIVKYTKKWKN